METPAVTSNTPFGNLEVVRLNGGQPIIEPAMFAAVGVAADGANINGPSLLRVPDWVPPADRAHPSAAYYLYFADHSGRYIRLAWAQHVEGPWTLYRTGADVPPGERGVLDMGDEGDLVLGNGLAASWHIASPDVLVDDANRRIEMYFHGLARLDGEDLGQKSFVATSATGLSFGDALEPVILGDFYFRVFRYRGDLYALAKHGALYRPRNPDDPWTPPEGFDFSQELWIGRRDNPFQNALDRAGHSHLKLRHVAVHVEGDTLWVFDSRVGDAPERLFLSRIDLGAGDFETWAVSGAAREILRPAPGWEGGELTPRPSTEGPVREDVNQLRDPGVFVDRGGEHYLLYCGRGEQGLGLARLALS
ncbi:MAG: hypothetical protein AAF657_30575 [Acidobacteriota bacterium]